MHALRLRSIDHQTMPHTTHDTGLAHRVVLSPDGRTCITCGGGFEACVWDLSKGTLLRCLQGHSSWVVDVAVSPDACRAVTASHDGRVMCVGMSSAIHEMCLPPLYPDCMQWGIVGWCLVRGVLSIH